MTEDNRRKNIHDEVTRAEQALRAAEALLGLGLNPDSISRAYYAVLHLVRALLFSRGVEPRTHAGAIHLFNTELVSAGLFPSSHNRILSGLQRSRELADYDAAVAFSADDAGQYLEEARLFAQEASAFLRKEGWIP